MRDAELHPQKADGANRILIGVLLALIIAVSISIVMAAIFVVKRDLRISHAENTGDKIIFALNQFEKKNDFYPSDLGSLVPDYLPSVPPPATGAAWNYWTSGQSFELDFGDDGALPEYYFDSERPGWREKRS